MFKFSKAAAASGEPALLAALNRSQAAAEFTPDGVILSANQKYLDLTGYDLSGILGQHHSLFMDPAQTHSAEYRDMWSRLASGAFVSGEFKRRTKSGREIWIQASYNPVLDATGKAVKVTTFATDITALKTLTAELVGQAAAVSKSLSILSFTPDGVILDANENVLKTTGYALNDIKGQHHRLFADADTARSEDYRQFWADLQRGLNPAGAYRRVGKGGRIVWIQATYTPVMDASGRVSKIIEFAMDITQKRQFDFAIDEKFGDVASAISGVTRQAEAAASSVQQATGSMQSVSAGAEELSASIKGISSNVANTKSAVDAAMRDVALAAANTGKLSSGAAAMNSIIDFIQDVASNINLLALNATIESARAGAAGKGFAVVASEVKNLANQVAQATKKISSEIANIQTVSGDVVKALTAIERGMRNVETSVTSVAGAIDEQTAVTSEISTNMQMTTDAVREIEANLQTIRTSASGIDARSQALHAEFKRAAG